MLWLDFDFSIFDFLTSKKVLLVSQNISSAFLLFFFLVFFFRRLLRLTFIFFGLQNLCWEGFFSIIFLEKKLIFLQNPKKRTRYIHEIFAVFQNNFRILSNVFASSKSQILVREDFLLLFFFFHFLAAAGHKIRLFIMGRVVVFDFGVEFFQVGFDFWLISFCSWRYKVWEKFWNHNKI